MYDKANAYLDLASETATILMDEMTAANRRALAYFNALFDIAKSATSTEPENAISGGMERVSAVISLNMKELETSLRSGAEVVEKLVAQSKKLQQAGS
jgi:hypothetical protein